MKGKILIPFFLLLLVASTCAAFISYSHKKTVSQECPASEKCDQAKPQSDFILLESISKHLLSSSEN